MRKLFKIDKSHYEMAVIFLNPAWMIRVILPEQWKQTKGTILDNQASQEKKENQSVISSKLWNTSKRSRKASICSNTSLKAVAQKLILILASKLTWNLSKLSACLERVALQKSSSSRKMSKSRNCGNAQNKAINRSTTQWKCWTRQCSRRRTTLATSRWRGIFWWRLTTLLFSSCTTLSSARQTFTWC